MVADPQPGGKLRGRAGKVVTFKLIMERCILEGVGGQPGGTLMMLMMMMIESRSSTEKSEYGLVCSRTKWKEEAGTSCGE